MTTRVIAAVFAHPDDETFATGGLLAKAAASGIASHLFCATDGDAGKTSGLPVESRQELAALRRTELHLAARHLGIQTVRAPGHSDGALAQVDPDLLVGEIVALLRETRPTVIVTFGPEGAPTGHRDHRAISRAATAAFHLASMRTSYPDAGPPHVAQRLYYVTYPPPLPGAALQLEGLPATAAIDVRDYNATKHDAFRLHATQRQHEHHFIEIALVDKELYALASGVAQPAALVEDLFAGL